MIFRLSGYALIYSASIFSLSCLAMESSKKETQEQIVAQAYIAATIPFIFRVMTANVCNPAEVQRNPELYAKFSWTNRKDRIFKQILDENPDVIGFQEIRNEPGKSAVADLWEGLGKYGYEMVSFRNNPSELAFINTIAYKINKFALDKINRWWVSKTPDQFSDDWGNGWGRVSLMLTLYPIITKNIREQKVPSPNYNQKPIHIVNVHHGLKHVERMHANQILIEQVRQKANDGMVIVIGDFNSFSDDGGAEELELLTKEGYQEALNDLKTSEGVPVSGTFIGYSYDRFQSPKGMLAGQLDHIFVKTLSEDIEYKSSCHLNLKKYNEKAESEAKTEAELLMGPEGVETRDEFCSDHAAGIVDIIMSSNS